MFLPNKDSMKKSMNLPRLEAAGIGKRFKIFIEIARHPNGMTMSDVTDVFNDRKLKGKKFAYAKQSIYHHISILRDAGYITTGYDRANNHISLVCKVTKSGVAHVREEMCRLCQVMSEIEKEAADKK